jgi:hypothetical protein
MRLQSIASAASLALIAVTAASAQPKPAPAATPTPPPAADHAPDNHVTGPYAGAGGPHAFYDVGSRIDHMQQAASALPGGKGRAVVAQLNHIRAELKFRMKRHGGELRDFDREAVSEKLDHLAAQYPALAN